MHRAHEEEKYAQMWKGGKLMDVKRTCAFSISPVRFRGVPRTANVSVYVRPTCPCLSCLRIGTLLVFIHGRRLPSGTAPHNSRFTLTEDNATMEDSGALYILRRNDPTFRMVLHHTTRSDSWVAIHLERFLGLRASLALVYLPVDRVADATLLALLMVVLGGSPRAVAERFARITLMKPHPEHRPGQEHDRHDRRTPQGLEKWGVSAQPPAWCNVAPVRGLAVPAIKGDRARPAVVRAMAAIDILHNSSA